MKVLIIGGSGMLGHKLIDCWRGKFDVRSTIRGTLSEFEKYGLFDENKIFEKIDVENFQSVIEIVESLEPDVIVNAVGIIKQLETSKDVVKTLTLNSIFPHRLALLAEENNSRLITISTDCVFNGEKGGYVETDRSDALDLYGKSKYLGEIQKGNCLTLRTSIIGRELNSRHSLVEWFLSNRGQRVKGFVNAVYSGFPTVILADILAGLIENHPDLRGIYHLSSNPINKYELLKLIDAAYQAEIEIQPFEEFRIDRSLDGGKLENEIGFKPPDWDVMIKKMAADPMPYDDWIKE